MNQFPQSSKIKIFLQTDNVWMDYSTGHFQVVSEGGIHYLRCIELSEPINKKLVLHSHLNEQNEFWSMNLPINKDRHYDLQQDCIIAWIEEEIHEEIAISFLESEYCREIHSQILEAQGKKVKHFMFDIHVDIVPSISNLDAVQGQIVDYPDQVIRNVTSNNVYLDSVSKVFQEAEEHKQKSLLEQLYYIMKGLIYLKSEEVMKALLSDRYYMITFGIMECIYLKQKIFTKDHNENQMNIRNSYREFLQKNLKFFPVFEVGQDILEKIHFNYRLTYLKESVMAYYLYMEDPTYNQFNQILAQNNQYILENILNRHQDQFEWFLKNLSNDIILSCRFLNEFYITFRQFLQFSQINKKFFDCVANSHLFNVLQHVIKLTLQSKQKDQQFICYTILLFQNMLITGDTQNFFQFLAEDKDSDLFWDNLRELINSENITTHIVICDLLYYVFPPPNAQQHQKDLALQIITNQMMEWLKRCLKSKLSSNSAQTLQLILQNLSLNQKEIPVELLTLSGPILDLMKLKPNNYENKLMIMAAIKHFKVLISQNQLYVHRFLKSHSDNLLDLQFKNNEGMLEGQIRDLIKAIKQNSTVGQYLAQKLKANCPGHLRPILDEFIYVQDIEQQIQPPESPSIRQNIEEEKYFEQDDEYEPQVQEAVEIPKYLLNMRMKKKQEEDDEEDKFIKKEIIFADNLVKKVKFD